MPYVTISGWRVGLRKVSMNRLLREDAKLGVREAKDLVDDVLDGKVRRVPMPDWSSAQELAAKLEELGAEAQAHAEVA